MRRLHSLRATREGLRFSVRMLIGPRTPAAGAAQSLALSTLDMENFKKLKIDSEPTKIVFILQTVENDEPPESAGACYRFFKRKTHAPDLLAGKLSFTVLGLGDSNLLLERQTTTAKDCNKCAQDLNKRLEELGGSRFYSYGEADERTGLTEVEPWINGLWTALAAP